MAKLIQIENTATTVAKLCVRPLNHFVNDGGNVRQFHFCPVCCEAGAMLGVDEGDLNCSFCGINLFWDDPALDGRGWKSIDD